jgi:hypothetical protein
MGVDATNDGHAIHSVLADETLSLKVVKQSQSLSDLMDLCLNGLLIIEATRGARVPSARVRRYDDRASTRVLQSRSNECGQFGRVAQFLGQGLGLCW